MKYTIKELIDDDSIMSHVFLNCLGSSEIAAIAKRVGDWEKKPETVSIELIIDGHSVNPKPFFNLFYEQWGDMVKAAATKMVKEQTSSKLNDMISSIQTMEEVLDYWGTEINWHLPNPYIKPKEDGDTNA